MSADAYAKAVLEHVAAMQRSDNSNAYRAFVQIISALRTLKANDDDGHATLTRLLSHESDNVRCWAASHLLPLDEAIAVDCLERLAATSTSNARYEAPLVLQEWRAGRLRGPLPV